jgi:hypothetical protein
MSKREVQFLVKSSSITFEFWSDYNDLCPQRSHFRMDFLYNGSP